MISFAVVFEEDFDGIRSSDRLMACIGAGKHGTGAARADTPVRMVESQNTKTL